jgi:hypothetical protein
MYSCTILHVILLLLRGTTLVGGIREPYGPLSGEVFHASVLALIFLVPGSGICDTRSSSLRWSSSAPRQGHGAMMFWLHRSRDRALVGDLDFRKADEQTRKRRPACRFMAFRSGRGPGLR